MKALIEVKWDFIKDRIMYFLMWPYIFFLLAFIIYTCNDLEIFTTYIQLDEENSATALRAIVLAFNSYFMILEIRKMLISYKIYFYNGWNYMDLGVFISIYVGEIVLGYSRGIPDDENDTRGSYERSIRTTYSFTAIFMWLRVLYYFRVFRATGYYIRMVSETILDVRYMMVINFTVISAFTHAWYVFWKNDPNIVDNTLTEIWGYVYRLCVADYDVDVFYETYGEKVSWAFFTISSLLATIVFLNIIISIVGDTFARIRERYNIIMYKDMLYMMVENRYLAVGKLNEKLRKQHLLMAVIVEG